MSAFPGDPIIQFKDAIAAAGLAHQGVIIADGRLHRFKANGDRNPNGWYVLHPAGIPAGSFGHWNTDLSETWCAKGTEVLTAAERAERDRQWQQQRAERDADRRRAHDQATTKAQALLDASQPADSSHPYLARKGIRAHPGVRVGTWPKRRRRNCLLIPLRTLGGSLVTVQAIYPVKPINGRDKDLLKGSTKKGACFIFGDLATAVIILIATGYATSATLYETTGYAVVMAIDDGSLEDIAKALRAQFPDKQLVLCGDNDRHTPSNSGVIHATAAAKAIGAALAIPDVCRGRAGLRLQRPGPTTQRGRVGAGNHR